MTTEQNKVIVQRIGHGLYGAGDTSLIDALFAEDYINHSTPPGFPSDREGTRQHVEAMWTAMDDVSTEITHLMGENDLVCCRWVLRARHTGPFMGIPATGNSIEVSGITIYRLADGKIVEEWNQSDNLGMMQQLGVIPSQEQMA